MKVKDLISPIRRIQSDRKAVAIQATFDPHQSDVVRLHMVPLRAGPFNRMPSMVFINGWHLIMVGPAWSDLLRAFIEVLKDVAQPGKLISYEELEKIIDQACERMQVLYPQVPRIDLVQDLKHVLDVCQGLAHDEAPIEDISSGWDYKKLARHMHAPHRMDLLVSPMIEKGEWMCPLHCKGCYAAKQSGMIIKKELSTEDWKTIIDKCRTADIPQLTFTGGEPTQRKDLVELIWHAKWHITRLNTNGLNLTPEYCQALFDAELDGVQVTLYSDNHSIHDNLVGKLGAWVQTIQGIQNALKAGLSVSVNTPLMRLNSNFDETLRLISSLRVKYATCSGLIPAGAAPQRIKSGEALTNAELFKVMQSAVETAHSLALDLTFTSPGWLSSAQLQELGLTEPICGACLSNMAIMPNGAVTACQSWLQDKEGLGNMLTTEWKEIWDNPQCKRMRRASPEGCPLQELQS